MAAGSTYTPLATTTLGSAQANITFSSISGSYTDLVIVANFTITSNAGLFFRLNTDSSTNYSDTRITGNGSAAASARDTGQTGIYLSTGDLTTRTMFLLNIMNYSNTTTYKTTLSRWANESGGTNSYVGLWRSTAAVNSVTITSNAYDFTSGSTFTLYGIASA
jgi:hypothetical protein